MAFKMKRAEKRSRPIRKVKKGFDIGTWLVPTLSFMIFSYAMVFIVFYTIRVGGANVSLYTVEETPRMFQPKADVEQMLQGISDAFDPNKKY